MVLNFSEINHNEFNDNHDTIPAGWDLVVVEKSAVDNGTYDSAMTLYGYDEIGLYNSDFNNPVYGYLEIAGGEGFSVVEGSN